MVILYGLTLAAQLTFLYNKSEVRGFNWEGGCCRQSGKPLDSGM